MTYVGELGYELHVPADQGASVWEAWSRPATSYGLRQVGLLAMSSLRLEKGYRDYGLDIENTDDPLVAGLAFTIAWDKPGGFVGREALLATARRPLRADGARPARRPRAAARRR